MDKEERIAKLIARAGVCSRRQAEQLIIDGRVKYQGDIVSNLATKVSDVNLLEVDGKKLKLNNSKLWLYHKPVGLIVSHNDQDGRDNIFQHLPIRERVISVGRLDKNTSGLLLLTNDGALSRYLELPKNNFKRVYKARIYGNLDFKKLQQSLSKNIIIDSVTYRPVEISLEKSHLNNHWIILTISEGKNREIRNILSFFGFKISRLIRIQYGPFQLSDLKVGEVRIVDSGIFEKDIGKVN